MKTYRKSIGVVAGILLFVHGLPGFIEDSKEWGKWLRLLAEWHWWNYALVAAGLIGLLYSTYPFFKELYKRFLTSEAAKEQKEVLPDCTLCELRSEIENLLETKYPDFEPFVLSQDIENFLCFLERDDSFRKKFHKGEICVWGHETKYDHPEDPFPPPSDIRQSPELDLIPKNYWEFNRINLSRQWINEINTHRDEKTEYTQIKFNKNQVLREIEKLFQKPPQEIFDHFNEPL